MLRGGPCGWVIRLGNSFALDRLVRLELLSAEVLVVTMFRTLGEREWVPGGGGVYCCIFCQGCAVVYTS